jgi:hypothetical protein
LADSVTYQFTMDTSSLSGTGGFIDMQFSESGFTGPGAYNTDATATVSNFQTDGSLVSEDPYTTTVPFGSPLAFGDLTGILPSSVVFTADGDGSTNDYTQGITFGSQLSFDLTLAGQGVTTPICPGTGGTSCSAPGFFIDFFDSTGSTFLFSNDPTGTGTGWVIGGVDVNLDTTTTPFLNPGPNGGPSDLTITPVPEPSALLILASGLIVMLAVSRRRTPKKLC